MKKQRNIKRSQANGRENFAKAFLYGMLAYAVMPRYCPRCYGLHSPLFWPYPGGVCPHEDDWA